MIKVLLCLGVITSGWYIGRLLGNRFKERAHQLQLTSTMLTRLKLYIECENLRTSDIFVRLSNSDSLCVLGFVSETASGLRDNPNFPVVWQECLSHSNGLALNPEDYALLMRLGELIGQCDTVQTCAGIDAIQSELDELIQDATAQNATTGGLCRRLGILCGVAAAILAI